MPEGIAEPVAEAAGYDADADATLAEPEAWLDDEDEVVEEDSFPMPALSGTLAAASSAEVAPAMLRPVKLEKKLESSWARSPESTRELASQARPR